MLKPPFPDALPVGDGRRRPLSVAETLAPPTSIDAESLQEHAGALGSAGEAHRRRAFAGQGVLCSRCH